MNLFLFLLPNVFSGIHITNYRIKKDHQKTVCSWKDSLSRCLSQPCCHSLTSTIWLGDHEDIYHHVFIHNSVTHKHHQRPSLSNQTLSLYRKISLNYTIFPFQTPNPSTVPSGFTIHQSPVSSTYFLSISLPSCPNESWCS